VADISSACPLVLKPLLFCFVAQAEIGLERYSALRDALESASVRRVGGRKGVIMS